MVIAMILAGGYGKRLRPLTLEIPKPLVKVGDKAVIEYQIEWLKYYGIDEIVVLAGYLKEKIIEHLGSGLKYGVSITYVVEDEPLGTGGALKNASSIIKRGETVVIVNGDVITNLDPIKLVEDVKSREVIATIAAVPLRSPYGILSINEDKRLIVDFKEKPVLHEYWINGGVYAFKSDIVEYLPEYGDIEKTAFPELAARGLLGVIKYNTPPYYWKSIDTHKDLEEAAKELQAIGGLLGSLSGRS
ncbi:MAG: nucleotidyltransferase family protein [Desulfurococcales archaeon]|nr:nucleotidyltransferase family protein [Desulfurococcales archaeon]